MITIAVLFANYGPYHLARLNAFYRLADNLEWNVVGIELASSEIQYPWEITLKETDCTLISVIKNKPLEQTRFIKLNYLTYTNFSKINPDIVVIAGYSRLPILLTLVWAKIHKRKIILMSATKENDAPRAWWVERIKSFILKGYDAALVGGKPQKRYLEKLGMTSNSIFTGYNVVGNDDFHPNKIKSLLSPHKKPFFLAINRFVPKKNIPRLIAAYAEYRKLNNDNNLWDLVLCGDGELRCQIEHQITELGIEQYIYLPGFLQQNELLPYFAHASCFIHASTQEQWGLVVNEAMAAGLLVLVSNRCGCFEDLIIEGVNGFGFNPEDTQQLTDLMVKVTSGNVNLKQIGQAALNHIKKFSPDYFAQGLMQSIEYALHNS